jgi:hypothetical protein
MPLPDRALVVTGLAFVVLVVAVAAPHGGHQNVWTGPARRVWAGMHPRKALSARLSHEQPASDPESGTAAERRSAPRWARNPQETP